METVIQTPPRMVSVRELAELTNVSQYAIRRLCTSNQIAYVKSGTKTLVNYDRFIDFLNGNT